MGIFDPTAPDLMDQLDDLARLGKFAQTTTEADLRAFVAAIPDPVTAFSIWRRLQAAARRGGRPPISEQDSRALVAKVAERYSEVEQIYNWGPRAWGTPRPDDDWLFLIVLHKDCYDTAIAEWLSDEYNDDSRVQLVARSKIEQRIAYDRALEADGVKYVFARPDGSIGSWTYGPDDPVPVKVRYTTWSYEKGVHEYEFDPARPKAPDGTWADYEQWEEYFCMVYGQWPEDAVWAYYDAESQLLYDRSTTASAPFD
jgi:hypothetical protein